MSSGDPTLFIDRNTGGRTTRGILQTAGLSIVLHDDHLDKKTPDEVWLKWASERGYIVITGDKDVTHRLLFLRQVVASNARVFILYGLNGGDPEKRAACVLAALPRIKELMIHGAPCIWKIGKDNRQANRCDHEKILRELARRMA